MSSHGKRVVGYFELCGKAPRARIIPTAAIPQSAEQPLRRQRNTVSGWTIIRLSRNPTTSATARSTEADPKDASRGDEFGRLQHRDWMAQRDNFQHKCGAGSGSPCDDGECSFSRHPYEASLSEAETTTESARIRF